MLNVVSSEFIYYAKMLISSYFTLCALIDYNKKKKTFCIFKLYPVNLQMLHIKMILGEIRY